MRHWHGLADVPEGTGPHVVTIGVFDGVHRGHQAIISAARAAADRLALPLAVVTFDPHPAEVVRPGGAPPKLCALHRRVALLASAGADAVCVVPFTLEFSQHSAEEFVRVVLAGQLAARWVTVGENFRFGHRAAGDAGLLAELGRWHGFTAEAVPLLAGAGAPVSSSGIRSALAAGDVAAAQRDLGRPHRVEGPVVRGERRGRALGFPTANLAVPPGTAIPADGVYAGWLAVTAGGAVDARRWPAAISVGTNPTFGGKDRVVEAYALDRDDLELYGEPAAVDFTARLRGMVAFGSVADLVAQMRLDVDQARELTTLPGTAPGGG